MSSANGLPSSLQIKLLRSILEFMVRSGLSEGAIRNAFGTCLRDLEERNHVISESASRECKYVGNGNVSAELIRLWTRDSRYLDEDARPKPLPLSVGRNNLTSLVAKLDPAANAQSVVESMRSVGLLRRLPNGKYVPTAESVTIDHLHPLAVEHVAKSLIRLITTVCRNTDPKRRSMPLIERYAYVPDLSEAEAKAFAEFTRTQGMAYLEAVDDWLEQRRVRRQSEKSKKAEGAGITAGVHLVAYLGDGAVAPSRAPSMRRRSIARPAARA